MRRKSLVTIVLSVACIVAGSAHGSDKTGWELYRQALAYANSDEDGQSADALAAKEYEAYVFGAVDMLRRENVICVPQEVSYEAIIATVYEALHAAPDLRQKRRSEIVHEVLSTAYPCAQEPAAQP